MGNAQCASVCAKAVPDVGSRCQRAAQGCRGFYSLAGQGDGLGLRLYRSGSTAEKALALPRPVLGFLERAREEFGARPFAIVEAVKKLGMPRRTLERQIKRAQENGLVAPVEGGASATYKLVA